MRVFCPTHKKGFFAPRQSPIKCENRGHTLGELDFEGDAKAPVELQWQYCCNCEHFSPIAFDQVRLERCQVCTRRSSMLYLCNRCYIISFESDTPLQTKNFTLTSEGAPKPSCPGCLHPAGADLLEHTCDDLGATFVTALNSCPVCSERLDIGPSFPSSVANYLRRTRAINKLNVTFDYETGLFVPVGDGEFVLITSGYEAGQPIVLPRSTRFATRRDFYEFYQDYYHCATPDAGEVQILQPAIVAATGEGWKPRSVGILEVVPDQPKKKAQPIEARQQVDMPEREKSLHDESVAKEEPVTPVTPVTLCTCCGAYVEKKYDFCWQCGNRLTSDNQFSVRQGQGRKKIFTAAVNANDDDESTVQHDLHSARSSIFPTVERERPVSTNRSTLKLMSILVAGFVLVTLAFFVLTRSAPTMQSVTAAQPLAPNMQSSQAPEPGKESTTANPTGPTTQVAARIAPEDDELKRLREQRFKARTSDRQKVIQAFIKSEKQFPNDYRFPYERAKLTIEGREKISHGAAFDVLSVAAKKAIKTGKAHEMLQGLEADKRKDFSKLSHGHHEWTQLVEALKNQDPNRLSELEF